VQLLEEQILAPSIPIGRVDILHLATLAHVGVVVTLERLGNEITQQYQRTRGVAHQLGQVFTLQATVLGILFLARVEDHNINHLAIHVQCGMNGRCQLTHGGREKVVSRVDNGELGQQSRAPSVLVGTGAEIGVVTKIFGDVLGDIAVAHDDTLVVGFEEADNVQFELTNDIAHAALRGPHVVVKTKVDSPNTGGHNLVLLVMRSVVIGREAEVSHRHRKQLQRSKNIDIVRSLSPAVRVDGLVKLAGASRVRGRGGEDTSTNGEHGGSHEPISVLTKEGTARHEGIGNNPNVEEQKENINNETKAECGRRRVTDAGRDQNRSNSHDVKGKNEGTIVSGPMVVASQESCTNGTNTIGSPASSNTRVEDAVHKTGSHCEDGQSTVRSSDGSTHWVSVPDPRDHGARVGQKRNDSKHQTAESNTGQNRRALFAACGQVITTADVRSSLGPQDSKQSEKDTNLVPTAVLGVHNRPKGVVSFACKLGNDRHHQTNAPSHDTGFETRSVGLLGEEASGPCCTCGSKSKASNKKTVGRIMELVGEKANEREQVKKAEVLRGCVSQGWDNIEQRGCAADNGNFIAGDTHVPEREVYPRSEEFASREQWQLTPDKNRQSSHNGPEDKLISTVSKHSRYHIMGYDYPVVNIGCGINDFGPEEALAKGVCHGLSLPTYVG
jgi:hypothetical protein